MVTDKSLLRTLFYTTESKMFYLQRHGYLLEKTVSHSADKINGKVGAIVFLYVSLQETAEISHEKFGNLTVVVMTQQKRNETCKETVGHRFAVNILYYELFSKMSLLEKVISDVLRKFSFQNIAYKGSSEHGTAPFIAENVSQRRNVLNNIFSIEQTAVRPRAQQAMPSLCPHKALAAARTSDATSISVLGKIFARHSSMRCFLFFVQPAP